VLSPQDTLMGESKGVGQKVHTGWWGRLVRAISPLKRSWKDLRGSGSVHLQCIVYHTDLKEIWMRVTVDMK
jgi:hypothetical protein